MCLSWGRFTLSSQGCVPRRHARYAAKIFPPQHLKNTRRFAKKRVKITTSSTRTTSNTTKTCSETPKTCSTCHATVANKRALVSHQKAAHPKATPGPTPNHKEVRCTTCDQTFKSSQGLKSHMKTHKLQTDCPPSSDHDDCKSCHVCNWLDMETGKKRKKTFDEHMTGHKKREQELEWELDRLRSQSFNRAHQ